jgi:hypothetical protein
MIIMAFGNVVKIEDIPPKPVIEDTHYAMTKLETFPYDHDETNGMIVIHLMGRQTKQKYICCYHNVTTFHEGSYFSSYTFTSYDADTIPDDKVPSKLYDTAKDIVYTLLGLCELSENVLMFE